MSTPRTDVNKINVGSDCGGFSRWMVEVDFSESLETELTAVTKERDEARETLETWRFHSESWGTDPDAVRRHILGVTRELAAEREKVAKLRDALSDMLFPAGAFTRPECEKLLADTAPKEEAK